MRNISIILFVLCFATGLSGLLLDYKTKTDSLNATAIELQLSEEDNAAIRAQAVIDVAEAQRLLNISIASEQALQNLVAEKNAQLALNATEISNLRTSLEISESRVSEIETQMQTTEQSINTIIEGVVLLYPEFIVEGSAIETKVESTTEQLQQLIVALSSIIVTQNQTIATLQLANTNLQLELDEAIFRRAELTTKLNSIEDIIVAEFFNNDFEQLQNFMHVEEDPYDWLTIDQVLQIKINELQAERDTLAFSISALYEQIAALQLEVETLTTDLATANSLIAELQVAPSESEEVLSALIARVLLVYPEIVLISSTNAEKVNELSIFMQAKIEDLTSQLSTANATILSLQEDIVAKQSIIDAKQSIIDEVTSKFIASEQVLATLIARVLAEYPEAEIVSIPENPLSNAEKANELSIFLETKIETLQGQLSSSAAQVVELQAEVADKQATIDSNATLIASLATKLANIENVIVSEFFNNNLEQLQNFQKADENPNNWLSLADVVQIKVDELQASISARESEISVLYAQSDALQLQIDLLTADLASAQAEIEALNTKLLGYVEYKYQDLQINKTFDSPIIVPGIENLSNDFTASQMSAFDGKISLNFYMRDSGMKESAFLVTLFDFQLSSGSSTEYGSYYFEQATTTTYYLRMTLPQSLDFQFSFANSKYSTFIISTVYINIRSDSACYGVIPANRVVVGATLNNPFSDLIFSGVLISDDLQTALDANAALQEQIASSMILKFSTSDIIQKIETFSWVDEFEITNTLSTAGPYSNTYQKLQDFYLQIQNTLMSATNETLIINLQKLLLDCDLALAETCSFEYFTKNYSSTLQNFTLVKFVNMWNSIHDDLIWNRTSEIMYSTGSYDESEITTLVENFVTSSWPTVEG